MKKLLLFSLVTIGGLWVYQQVVTKKAEEDLWTEATDSVPSGPAEA